ncbi:uncharacterized protein LOC132058917 isoform X3 [Lycium ferocissimum]|uniref:uncharacterized protein LOC132058917 isoform X3 n=1 Tax=Lycium ferocissimum TaxID=112874 RepID=UPI002814E45B|nr:uncharacterized protein LOC132058917 isoform X3 [Lycium ferocissimum]
MQLLSPLLCIHSLNKTQWVEPTESFQDMPLYRLQAHNLVAFDLFGSASGIDPSMQQLFGTRAFGFWSNLIRIINCNFFLMFKVSRRFHASNCEALIGEPKSGRFSMCICKTLYLRAMVNTIKDINSCYTHVTSLTKQSRLERVGIQRN